MHLDIRGSALQRSSRCSTEDFPFEFLGLLACPSRAKDSRTCEGSLEYSVDVLVCRSCGTRYVIKDGIPILLPAHEPDGARPGTWQLQRDYFDRGVDAEYEIERPAAGGRFYRYLLQTKFERAFLRLPRSDAAGGILDACCGSGILSEYLATTTRAFIVGFDFSFGAVGRAKERARRRGYQFCGVVGDASAPPFRKGAFSVVAIHDALHHLDDPLGVVSRLATLAKNALVVMEPAESWMTRIAVAVGFSTDVEEAGNRVERLTRPSLISAVRQAGFSSARARRYFMYYPHRPGPLFRVLDRWPLSWIGRLATLAGHWLGFMGGNKLQVVAQR